MLTRNQKMEIKFTSDVSLALEKLQATGKKAGRLALKTIKNLYNLGNKRECYYHDEKRTPESVRQENYIKYRYIRFY